VADITAIVYSAFLPGSSRWSQEALVTDPESAEPRRQLAAARRPASRTAIVVLRAGASVPRWTTINDDDLYALGRVATHPALVCTALGGCPASGGNSGRGRRLPCAECGRLAV
jgi:hypothetical protein